SGRGRARGRTHRRPGLPIRHRFRGGSGRAPRRCALDHRNRESAYRRTKEGAPPGNSRRAHALRHRHGRYAQGRHRIGARGSRRRALQLHHRQEAWRMKLAASDLKRLRLPIAACMALAAAGVASYFAATDYLQKAKNLAAATAAQRIDVQAKLASANEEEREIKANLQQYQALAARGIIGEENRLDWIDTITAIKNERRLFNIGYSIEPQKELDYPGFAREGGVKFVFSRVKVEIQLLHEEDLLNFIDDLAKRG